MDRNIDLARLFYDSLKRHDMATLMSLLHDDIHVEEPRSLPYAGDYRGKAAFGALAARLMETWQGFDFDMTEMLDAGDTIIALVVLKAKYVPTGRDMAARIAEFLTFKDGKIIKFVPYYWDTGDVISAG